MRLVLIGAPGSGKGTIARALGRACDVPHVESGALVRAEIAAGTALGETMAAYVDGGDLVPDALLLQLLGPALQRGVGASGGYVLDGFPRTLGQAQLADEVVFQGPRAPQAACVLYAPPDVLLRRLVNRSQGRGDDTAAVARHRLDVYQRETLPLLGHYRRQGILHEVDADRHPADVLAEVREHAAAAA